MNRSTKDSRQLAAFDVAALQYFYGAARGTKTGNDTYTFADKYVYDTAGIDTFDSRNGSADTVTTGAGGHQNTVYADKIDTVTWGYGLAGH